MVLDLYTGKGGFHKGFIDRGHTVITVDNEKKFNPTIVADIKKLSASDFEKYRRPGYKYIFDLILASPPCNCFSVLSIPRYWKNGKPKNQTSKEAIALVKHTQKLIKALDPPYWIMENPRAMLRKIIGRPTGTVTYCQYGARYMKATDLWGKHPPGLKLRRCKNGDLCHEPAPRGSKTTGVQRLSSPEIRALVPEKLSLEIALACEAAFNAKTRPKGQETIKDFST